jgi:hypothetical protein
MNCSEFKQAVIIDASQDQQPNSNQNQKIRKESCISGTLEIVGALVGQGKGSRNCVLRKLQRKSFVYQDILA